MVHSVIQGMGSGADTHLLRRYADGRLDFCLEPGRREVGVMDRGVRRAGMRGAVIGATGRCAMPLLASGMLPLPPTAGAAGMAPYGLVLMPACLMAFQVCVSWSPGLLAMMRVHSGVS